DVELKKVVLQWDNRKDDTITDIGVLKAGGSTTPQDAPGRKGRLTAVTVEYKIVGEAPTARVKVWGYDWAGRVRCPEPRREIPLAAGSGRVFRCRSPAATIPGAYLEPYPIFCMGAGPL